MLMSKPGFNGRYHAAKAFRSKHLQLAVERLYLREIEAGRVTGSGPRIAAELGINRSTVKRLLDKCRAALPAVIETQAVKIRDAIIRRNTAARERLDKVEAEITAEWHRSKLDEQSTEVEQQVSDGKPFGVARVKKRTKGQTGNPAYTAQMVALEAARLALDKELRDLLGVDAPTKIAPTDPTGQKSYEPLTEEERAVRLSQLLDRIKARREAEG
jgi:hypothetical protein